MFRSLATAAVLAIAIAAPASAVTLVAGFNGTGASPTASNISLSVTVSGISFANVAPNALTSITANTPTVQSLTFNAGGLGIAVGGSDAQMDTNQVGRREAFLVTGTSAFKLTNLVLTNVDADDTLQIYGVRTDGTLRNFTFGSGTSTTAVTGGAAAGTIRGGAGGSLLNLVNTSANSGTSSFGTGIEGRFERYLITTRVGGNVNYLGTAGQGFALSGLTAAVPEPASWAMLIVGFGMVGAVARRRKTAVAA
jgi:hypothetical protein